MLQFFTGRPVTYSSKGKQWQRQGEKYTRTRQPEKSVYSVVLKCHRNCKDTMSSQDTNKNNPKRSILKQSSSQLEPIETLPLSKFQLPTQIPSKADVFDSNNTTSRINTLKLQGRVDRRVSFAPDVTLHSFDFVPDGISSQREPRRKQHEDVGREIVTSTQREQDADQSMDMTNIFTKSSQEMEDMKLSNIPSSLPTDANKGTGHSKSIEEEEPMELTETFNVDKEPLSQRMELTQLVTGKEQKNNEPYKVTGQYTVNLSNDMDFTQVVAKIPVQPKSTEKKVENTEDMSMEVTELLQKPTQMLFPVPEFKAIDSEIKTHMAVDLNLEESASEPMELTQVVTKKPENIELTVENDSGINTDKNAMGNPDFQRVDSTAPQNINDRRKSLIPVSSKRRKLNTSDELPVAAESIDGTEEMELTIMERMSPIQFDDLNASVQSKINHSNDLRTKNSYSTDDLERYSLRKFLGETNLGFLLDANTIKDDSQVLNFSVTHVEGDSLLRSNNLYDILYVDIPVLEMNSFICRELIRKISQSQSSFENLENQIKNAPPPLLMKEYYASGGEIKKLMNEQLQLVKQYSKLEAKKAWYEWRKLHLNGITHVLLENLTILQEEYDKIEKDLQKIQQVNSRVKEIKNSISHEIKLLRELPANMYNQEPTLTDKVNIARLRQELKSHSISLGNLPSLKAKHDKLKEDIENTTAILSKAKMQIKSLDDNDSHLAIIPEHSNVVKLQKKLKYLEQLNGVSIISFKGSILELGVDQLSANIALDLSLLRKRASQFIYITQNESHYDAILDYFLEYIISKTNKVARASIVDGLSFVFSLLRRFPTFQKEYHLLRMLFSIHIMADKNYNQPKILRLTDYDFKKNVKLASISMLFA